jgi:thiamine-phosphate pyrophosphorylase
MRRRTSDLGPRQHIDEVLGPTVEGRFPLLYYITDRTAFPGDESTRRRRLLEKIAEATRAGVDYIQLREKDLPARDLEQLANQAIKVMAETRKPTTACRPLTTALVINSRIDVVLATGAEGVHLRSTDVSPVEIREIWKRSECGANAHELAQRSPLISIACHSPEEVSQAATNRADLAILAPIFEKKDAPNSPAAGLAQLREACRNKIPVLALGGITLENARSCLAVGAAGIAAIRLFQENDIAAIVRKLRP